ncbi:hypothetical protein [Pseudomonas sp. 35 E 8]|nr:hypothetical protein [Pseudomonas sp. 35 E 8]
MRIRQIDRRHAFGQWHRHMRLGQHQAHAAVFKHMQQAFTRVLRVQRHIGATGLEHRQQADHHVERTLDRHAHQHFRANALADQVMREAVGLAIQFGVADGLVAQTQGNRVWALPHLGFEQTMYALLNRCRCAASIPLVQQALLLSAVKQRECRNRLLRIAGHGGQQVLPMLRQARYCRGFEQVSGIAQRGPQAFSGLLGVQAQIEMRRVAVPFQPFHAQAGQLLATRHAGLGLMVEHHLEQWVEAQAAFRLQRFHQLLERQVLMGLGIQGPALGLLQQLGKGHLPVDVGLEYLGVDEEAYQTLGFYTIAVGDRHTHADIRLAAVAMQQGLERGQQQHEQGHAFALRQGFEGCDDVGLKTDIQPRATVTLNNRAWMIQRQLKYRLLAAEQVAPVRHLALLLAGLHPVALPHGVIGVLQRHQRQ